jgi:hypothetical protein
MPGVARFQAFSENVLELGFQCIDMANARSARGHLLLGILLEFHKIEVIPAIFHRRSFG